MKTTLVLIKIVVYYFIEVKVILFITNISIYKKKLATHIIVNRQGGIPMNVKDFKNDLKIITEIAINNSYSATTVSKLIYIYIKPKPLYT